MRLWVHLTVPECKYASFSLQAFIVSLRPDNCRSGIVRHDKLGTAHFAHLPHKSAEFVKLRAKSLAKFPHVAKLAGFVSHSVAAGAVEIHQQLLRQHTSKYTQLRNLEFLQLDAKFTMGAFACAKYRLIAKFPCKHHCHASGVCQAGKPHKCLLRCVAKAAAGHCLLPHRPLQLCGNLHQRRSRCGAHRSRQRVWSRHLVECIKISQHLARKRTASQSTNQHWQISFVL